MIMIFRIAFLLVLFSASSAFGLSIDELDAEISNLQKEIDYLKDQRDKGAGSEKRRLDYAIDEKSVMLAYKKTAAQMLTQLKGKQALDGFDLVESVTKKIVSFYQDQELSLRNEELEINSRINEIVSGRLVVLQGRARDLGTSESLLEKPNLWTVEMFANMGRMVIVEDSFTYPFRYWQFNDKDAAYKAVFFLADPIKTRDRSRLQRAKESSMELRLEGVLQRCQIGGSCVLDEWVVIR